MELARVLVLFVLLQISSATVVGRDENNDDFVKKVKEDHAKDGQHKAEFDRDVMWGDEGEDEDEVEKLTPGEQRDKLRKLVEAKVDLDNDGFVSMEELTTWCKRSYDLFETEEARSIFPDYDRNKDGVIDWSEYALDSYGEDFNEESPDFINPPTEEWEDFVKTYKKEKKKFNVADLDESGDLDLQEYQYFKHPRLHEKTRQLVIDEVLESSDLDKDGAIDLNEFLGDYQKNADDGDPEWAIFEKEKFQDEFDLDKDGFLKGEEIIHWNAPDNSILAREEAEHLMDESDTNHDDELSIDEIVNSYAEWVDSDATDYGRHLLVNHEEL